MSPGRGVQISHLAYGDNDSAGWSWSKFAASDRLSADRSWKDVDVFVDDLLMRRHARAANSSYRISGWLFPRRLSPARRNLHSFSHLTFPSQEINSCHLTFPATTISNNLQTFSDLFFHVRDSRNPSRCHLWTMISRLGSQWQMFHHWVGLKMIGTSKWTNSNPNQLILWFQTKSPKWTWAYLSYQ